MSKGKNILSLRELIADTEWADATESDNEPSEEDEESGEIGESSGVTYTDFDEYLDPSVYTADTDFTTDCACSEPGNCQSALFILSQMLNIDPNFEIQKCLVSNVIRCYNYIFMQRNSAVDHFKLAYADLYFRLRHELLFKCLCLCFNLPVQKSDKPFSDFGIESKRTPDLLMEINGVLHIIEVTATSSTEKAAQAKGMEQMGFESKYSKEIRMLNDLGIANTYMPMFFDMSNLSHPVNREQYNVFCESFQENKSYKPLLMLMAKEFAIVANNLKQSLATSSAILFTEIIPIKNMHSGWEFLYKRGSNDDGKIYYKEMKVSTNVYNKVCKSIQRFYDLIDNSKHTDLEKLFMVINTDSNRFYLEKNYSGFTLNEMRGILDDNDMIEILKFVRLKSGNVLMSCLDSETGVKFIEKVSGKRVFKEFEPYPLLCQHEPKHVLDNSFDCESYIVRVQQYNNYDIRCNIVDYNYEDELIKSICEADYNRVFTQETEFKVKMLGQMDSRLINIDKVISEKVIPEYYIQNTIDETLPIKKNKMKSPFLLPFSEVNSTSYCELSFKNVNFVKCLISELSAKNPYTTLILRNICGDNYSMYSKPGMETKPYRDLINRRSEVSNKINLLQRKLYRSNPTDKIYQLSKTQIPEYKDDYLLYKNEFNQLCRDIKKRRIHDGIGQDISYIRLPTKNKKGTLRGLYESEMVHFKDKRISSTIEGVGFINGMERDYERNRLIFDRFTKDMTVNCGSNPDKIMDNFVSNDVRLLEDLKKITIAEYEGFVESVCNSRLGHSAALVSRMAHSLLYYSQLPFSSDYIRVDNLGYKNVLLIVKGGKKIFKSKASKFFRIIYPINENIVPWYTFGHSDKGSIQIIEINGALYNVTPWAMLHESVLTDSLSFYQRIVSFVVLNLNPSIPFRNQFHKVSLNVTLSFHNRRQTETLMANLRYILLSTLGDFTGVDEIITEFFGFNYDCLQSFLRCCIIYNYPTYFKHLQFLKNEGSKQNKEINESEFINSRMLNIFTGETINNTEELALMIYSTFLMTKAPYQRLVERANNLKGILKIHQLYDEKVGLDLSPEEQHKQLSVTCNGDYKSYVNNLFDNDFKFDPKYCALVGNFMDSYFLNLGIADEIHNEWVKCLNKSWDDIAKSTGLRGNYDDVESFWGQKGYFVVYKDLLKNKCFTDQLENILFEIEDSDERRKKLRLINEIYSEKIEGEREFLIFHAVDKTQWKGGREIFVMDVFTKIMQQPIENFMGYICSKIDNEIISVPSDRRAQLIHHSLFEKDIPLRQMMNWYLTLDCSKWAPKSIFSKFAIAINNMSVIPNSFKFHFLNYIEKLYKKRIYFNKGEVEVLIKNFKYKGVCERYLIKDEKVGGYYMEMPYSWVMGIFNYTSSFLHAANQKYFSYLLMKSSIISYKEESSIMMFAHSDDSGGRLCVSNREMAVRALCLYEINLKCCNHLLSKKKSVVSRIYFEILSIIYMFNKLLALLPKFLGGLRFLPTDKGPAQDMLQSYSKCIEVIIAGADFGVAYMVLKFYSHLVWRFYYNRKPTAEDYLRPVQYLGIPDAHPIFVLLCGSDSDLIRLMSQNVDLSRILTFVNVMSSQGEGEGPIKPLKFLIKVKGLSRDFDPFIEKFETYLGKWSVRNVNYHNTAMNTLSFLKKLSDPGFVGSLVNESPVRRISRSFFIRSGYSSVTRLGPVKLSTLLDSLILFQGFNSDEGCLKMILHEIMSEDDIKEINNEMESNHSSSMTQITLLRKTLAAPLKIANYMSQLGMEGRKIVNTTRTLKPTHVQLVKSSKVFSSTFDPASLVSYVKEPEMNWALSNVKNLYTSRLELEEFCEGLGVKMNDLNCDMLLRICRTYSRDNTKNIYLYSRVPSDVRQIKSYTAFLTFLSVNTFSNREIEGLVLKLSDREVGKEYLPTNVSDTVYLLNNLISLIHVMSTKCDYEFLQGISIKPIPEINYPGGTTVDLLKFVGELVMDDSEMSPVRCQYHSLLKILNIRNCSADIFTKGSFYTFLKSQKLRSGWYGKGEVYINVDGYFYSFILDGKSVREICTNKTGKMIDSHINYILDVFNEIDINLRGLKRPRYDLVTSYHFGVDMSQGYSILPAREITLGVPAKIIERRNEFVDNLVNYEIREINKANIIVEMRNEFAFDRRKINVIPVKKTEMIPLIPRIFMKEEFESKLLSLGLNDFEEFILTEVLTEYGQDVYVGFDSVFDNFSSSRIYEIFQKSHQNGWSKLPRNVKNSVVPSPEGSLSRILIDYSRCSGDNVLKTPLNLNSTIMSLRSEYPEDMSVILSENLVKCHNQIYSSSEIKEIEDSYFKISTAEDLDSARATLIKLMTYWGYGSLVNSLQNFTLVRSSENFVYFNLSLKNNSLISLYSKIYVDLMIILKDCFERWRVFEQEIDPPIRRLKNKVRMVDVYRNEIFNTIYSLYSFNYSWINKGLYHCLFLNNLLGYLSIEECVADLQNNLSSHFHLGCLDISYKNRFDFVVLLNTLKCCWEVFNVQKLPGGFDYTKKLMRLPDNIVNQKDFANALQVHMSPAEVYFGTFGTESLFNYLKSARKIVTKDFDFRVKSKICKPSTVSVPMNDFIYFSRPLQEDFLDSDEFEDFKYELTMAELDEDTLQDAASEMGQEIFVSKKTKQLKVPGKKIIDTTVCWIIDPNINNKSNAMNRYRQVGENIVVLTNCLLVNFTSFFKNSGARLVNYTNILGSNQRTMIAYYSFCPELDKDEFIKKYIGGDEFVFSADEINLVMPDKVRDLDGKVKSIGKCGHHISDKLLQGSEKVKLVDGCTQIVSMDEGQNTPFDMPESSSSSPLSESEKEQVEKMEKFDKMMADLRLKGGLSDDSFKEIENKYLDAIIGSNVSLKVIMSSAMKMYEMLSLDKAIVKGEIDMSADDQKKAFLAPEHFGLVHSVNRSEAKPIKDKKLRAELDSIKAGISTPLASCSLKLSNKFKKVVCANYKMWLTMVKHTNYKTDNKRFLLNLFLTIINNSVVSDDESDDGLWQDMINRISVYIVDTGPESDEDDELIDLMFDFSSGARLQYRAYGV